MGEEKKRYSLPEGVVHVSMNLPQELLDNVDAWAEKVAGEMDGLKIHRTDAIRMLLIRGLQSKGAKK